MSLSLYFLHVVYMQKIHLYEKTKVVILLPSGSFYEDIRYNL